MIQHFLQARLPEQSFQLPHSRAHMALDGHRILPQNINVHTRVNGYPSPEKFYFPSNKLHYYMSLWVERLSTSSESLCVAWKNLSSMRLPRCCLRLASRMILLFSGLDLLIFNRAPKTLLRWCWNRWSETTLDFAFLHSSSSVCKSFIIWFIFISSVASSCSIDSALAINFSLNVIWRKGRRSVRSTRCWHIYLISCLLFCLQAGGRVPRDLGLSQQMAYCSGISHILHAEIWNNWAVDILQHVPIGRYSLKCFGYNSLEMDIKFSPRKG